MDDRNWQEKYKKLKVNFDRLDRFNDVLYRYWYTLNKEGGCTVEDMTKANQGVKDYMKELEDAAERRRDSEAPKQEG
jgi:hypothetical protein